MNMQLSDAWHLMVFKRNANRNLYVVNLVANLHPAKRGRAAFHCRTELPIMPSTESHCAWRACRAVEEALDRSRQLDARGDVS